MKIYMVLFDWSTSDDSAVDVELFDSYEKAYKRFTDIIKSEKEHDMSWAADAFDENGELLDGYEFDESTDIENGVEYELWWNLTDKNDWNTHDFLDLRIMEVK